MLFFMNIVCRERLQIRPRQCKTIVCTACRSGNIGVVSLAALNAYTSTTATVLNWHVGLGHVACRVQLRGVTNSFAYSCNRLCRKALRLMGPLLFCVQRRKDNDPLPKKHCSGTRGLARAVVKPGIAAVCRLDVAQPSDAGLMICIRLQES